MSIISSGFRTGQGFDPAGLRKPNEGEFQAVLPSGLPIPHKATDDVVIYELVVTDATIIAAVDSAELYQEHVLAVADAATVSIGETLSVTAEQALEILDSISEAVSDTLVLYQEHELETGDGTVVSSCDVPALTVEGDLILSVADGACKCVSGSITLTEISAYTPPVIVKRGRGMRYAYYPTPVVEAVTEIVLQVQDGFVLTTSETVKIEQAEIVSVNSAHSKVVRGATVTLINQKRRRRFVQEDELLLLAA